MFASATLFLGFNLNYLRFSPANDFAFLLEFTVTSSWYCISTPSDWYVIFFLFVCFGIGRGEQCGDHERKTWPNSVSDFTAGSCHFSHCLRSSWTFRLVNDHQSNWWLWVSDAFLNETAVASRSGQTSENEILSLVFPSHGMHYTHTCGITDGAIVHIAHGVFDPNS